jgi:hypothetical protein
MQLRKYWVDYIAELVLELDCQMLERNSYYIEMAPLYILDLRMLQDRVVEVLPDVGPVLRVIVYSVLYDSVYSGGCHCFLFYIQ